MSVVVTMIMHELIKCNNVSVFDYVSRSSHETFHSIMEQKSCKKTTRIAFEWL